MSASRAVLHFVCKCFIATAPFFAAWSAPRVAIGRYRLRRGVQLARQIDVHHVTAIDSPGSGKAGQCPLPELPSVEDNPPAGDCVTYRAHPHRSRDGLPAAVESGAVSAGPWGPGLAVNV
jgi:hypothetical protein